MDTAETDLMGDLVGTEITTDAKTNKPSAAVCDMGNHREAE